MRPNSSSLREAPADQPTGSDPSAPAGSRQSRSGKPKVAAKVADDRRTYVLDTSVLLADPGAFGRFAEHRVILPLVVITELEAKR
ncbi:MAG: PIN domain-containing protein, partial [Streptosporangiaceae bacterium]